MRITGGKLKGRFFQPKMKSWPTRPTTDISKEALFNILCNRIDFANCQMLDLFGGTGAHSLEFLSREAKSVCYVDKYPGCIRFVTELKKELNFGEEFQIVKSDVKKYILSCTLSYDYIFAGPPYPLPWLPEIPSLIFQNELLNSGGLFVLEHNADHVFDADPHFIEKRNYGQTHFSFFKS